MHTVCMYRVVICECVVVSCVEGSWVDHLDEGEILRFLGAVYAYRGVFCGQSVVLVVSGGWVDDLDGCCFPFKRNRCDGSISEGRQQAGADSLEPQLLLFFQHAVVL